MYTVWKQSSSLNQCWIIVNLSSRNKLQWDWHKIQIFHFKPCNKRAICSDLGVLTHWGRVTHICVGNLIIIGPDNGILLIGPWDTNFSEILIGIQTFSFKKMHLKMLSAKWRPFCLGFNVLIKQQMTQPTTVHANRFHGYRSITCLFW